MFHLTSIYGDSKTPQARAENIRSEWCSYVASLLCPVLERMNDEWGARLHLSWSHQELPGKPNAIDHFDIVCIREGIWERLSKPSKLGTVLATQWGARIEMSLLGTSGQRQEVFSVSDVQRWDADRNKIRDQIYYGFALMKANGHLDFTLG